jgi:hypothetical protein
MSTWFDRPPEVSILLNPAFCSLLIRAFCTGYQSISESGPSIVLTPLVLPLVLHGPTRSVLPHSIATKFSTWVLENDVVRINAPQRIETTVSYTREAMIFGLHHQVLLLDKETVLPGSLTGKKFSFSKDSEPKECVNSAEKIGKLFAIAETPTSIYSLLGIRP